MRQGSRFYVLDANFLNINRVSTEILESLLTFNFEEPWYFCLAHRYLCHWKTRFKGNPITDFCPVININSKPEGKNYFVI